MTKAIYLPFNIFCDLFNRVMYNTTTSGYYTFRGFNEISDYPTTMDGNNWDDELFLDRICKRRFKVMCHESDDDESYMYFKLRGDIIQIRNEDYNYYD